jgi:acetyltransferase
MSAAFLPAGRKAVPLPPLRGAMDRPVAAADAHAPLQLRDGCRLQVSALHAGDAGDAQAFVAGLSPLARYRRFHLGLPALPPSLLRHLVDVDQDRHVALAARVPGSARIVAEARYIRIDDGRRAELAIAVADEWQRRGMGRQLLHRLAIHARARGVRELRGDVLWDNLPMLALAKRLGAQLHAEPGMAGVLQLRLALAGPGGDAPIRPWSGPAFRPAEPAAPAR